MGKVFAVCASLLLLGVGARAADWSVEIVDQSGMAKYSSLKIDKDGNAHLAYTIDADPHPLKYAFWDHALKRWFVMTVAYGASFSSLVLDSHQHPHISYADFGVVNGCKLRYAYWDGSTWKIEAIPLNSQTIGYYTSIVLDAKDQPSISFYEYDGPRGTEFRVRLRNVKYNGRYWEVRTVDGQNQSGKFNDMAIDGEGHPHVIYANVNALTAAMRDAYWDGKSWHVQNIDDRDMNAGDLVGYSASVVADAMGNLHASYMNYSHAAMKYATRRNGQWVVQVVDGAIAGISYFDEGRGILKLAHRQGGRWMAEQVDGNGAGFGSSLQLHDGTIWVAYGDEPNGALKVARRPLVEQTSSTSQSYKNPTGPVPGAETR